MNTNQALVPLSDVATQPREATPAIRSHVDQPRAAAPKPSPAPEPLTDESVAAILDGRGLLGWLRVLNVTRVLGLFTLYLFLDTYDIRATFNRRMASRRQAETGDQTWIARLKSAWRSGLQISLDKLIRLVRFAVFRGAEGSANKEERLARQAVWLRQSLIGLGPTFVKIGQALGTRADLLPLAYVKELSTLQDQVPAFSTSDAYASIEAELGRSLQDAFCRDR